MSKEGFCLLLRERSWGRCPEVVMKWGHAGQGMGRAWAGQDRGTQGYVPPFVGSKWVQAVR